MKRLLCIICILTLALSGCSKSPGKSQSQGYTYSVSVVKKGNVLKKYSIDDIKKMPTKKIEVEGKTQEGPSLAYILQDVGAGNYSKVTLKGINKDSMELDKDKIDDGTILDIANRGTAKIATTHVSKDKWVKDIVEISVEE